MPCKQDTICMLFRPVEADECHWKRICKYYEDLITSITPGPKKKRTYTKRSSETFIDQGEEMVSRKDFDKARTKIQNARYTKKLTDNQERALETLKGLRFTTMSEAQKHQILNIANDI